MTNDNKQPYNVPNREKEEILTWIMSSITNIYNNIVIIILYNIIIIYIIYVNL